MAGRSCVSTGVFRVVLHDDKSAMEMSAAKRYFIKFMLSKIRRREIKKIMLLNWLKSS